MTPIPRYKRVIVNPISFTFVVLIVIVLVTIIREGGDPLALARLGTRYTTGNPNGSQGYDGQFIYYIAINPSPLEVERYLDVPAYRYQRILMPLLARFLSFGESRLIPWVLPLIGIISQVAGTWAVLMLLNRWEINSWYALVYGLWAGFTLSVRLNLPEPLAYTLVCWAILEMGRDRPVTSSILFGLSLFAKEVTILFVLAGMVYLLFQGHWKKLLILSIFSVVPYVIFQVWLWRVFGEFGIGSGGAMATPFEIIPFMGLLRIGFSSLIYLFFMALVFVPSIVIPSVFGVWISVKDWLKGERNYLLPALFFNALAIAFLPFSTFRETGGLLRFSCGLVLAVILYAGRFRNFRVLKYSSFWLVMNAFLLK